MQYALIRANRVENIIVADETFAARIEPEWQAVEPMQPAQDAGLAVAIGWGWAPGEPAPEPDPPAEGEPPAEGDPPAEGEPTDPPPPTPPAPRVPGTFIAPEPVPQPEPAPELRHITQLAFLSRFTDPEAIAIDLASIGATPQAAGMRRYLSKVNAATFIDLDRPDTRGGVQALEAVGILTEGRALEILDTPIEPQERPQGGAQ